MCDIVGGWGGWGGSTEEYGDDSSFELSDGEEGRLSHVEVSAVLNAAVLICVILWVGGWGGSTEGNKLSLAGDLVSRHPSRVCLLLRVGDGSFPSELAPSMEQLCGCFASVVCVCKQSLKFLGSVVYGCSSAPLVVPYLCYVLVIAMACCFTVSVRALSYRIGCLFYVSPAWTQRPCAVRPTGSCSMLWSKDSVQRSKFVNWFLYRCGDLLELTQSQCVVDS
ncbi:hypothetical protein Bca52824_002366 [Brassica carinata]|uniref:Uncharacterized protein n=1 Tax=Brassica carinata TaxID=52824 RepID=A0A8X7WJ28_BRACI|nr:hypothetical protein Bca52824_002366 [Brassica carinata]